MDPLVALLGGRRTLLLSGAGLSTDSGIPDYRSPGRTPRNPIQGPAFRRDPAVRQRYWARAAVGWPRFAAAQPNRGHATIAALQAGGHLSGVLTQNVDRLHQKAGSVGVIELHGALQDVVCLDCGAHEDRDAVQARLVADNPLPDAVLAPDGDAELPAEFVDRFVPPTCLRCGGALKPAVVFFGDNVPPATVDAAWAALDAAEALLVVGSSLQVWSGYRFAKKAHESGKPVVILNRGPTRADPLATIRHDGPLAALLPALAVGLSARGA